MWINRPQTGGLRLSASITVSWPGFSKLVECLWKGNYYKVTSWLLRAITHLHFHCALKEGVGRGACLGRGRTEAWPWTRDHTGPWALKQNKWTQTPGQLENRAGPPPQRSPQTFIILLRSWFHICRNSQGSDGKELPGHRNSPPTDRPNKSQFLLCIHAVSEPTMTAVWWPIWQYPAGSLGWSGQGLWSQSIAKNYQRTPAGVCGKRATEPCVNTTSEIWGRRAEKWHSFFLLFLFFIWVVFHCPITREQNINKSAMLRPWNMPSV